MAYPPHLRTRVPHQALQPESFQVNAYIPPGLTQTGEVTVEIYSDAFPNSLNSVTVYVGGDD